MRIWIPRLHKTRHRARIPFIGHWISLLHISDRIPILHIARMFRWTDCILCDPSLLSGATEPIRWAREDEVTIEEAGADVCGIVGDFFCGAGWWVERCQGVEVGGCEGGEEAGEPGGEAGEGGVEAVD